jgi:hypothetical protein
MSKPETKIEIPVDDDMPSTKEEVVGLDEDDDVGDPEFVFLTCGKTQLKVLTKIAKTSKVVRDAISALKKDNTPLDKFFIVLDQTQHMPEVRDEKTGEVTRKAFDTKPSIDPDSLKSIVKWMNLREGRPLPIHLPKPVPVPMKGNVEGLPDSAVEFIESVADPLVSPNPMFNLTNAANFMDIPDLLQLCLCQFAQWLKSPNQEIVKAIRGKNWQPPVPTERKTKQAKK